MSILKILYDELISFFGIGHWLKMFETSDYSSLQTFDGILSAIGPLIPLILVIEITRAAIYKRFKIEDYNTLFHFCIQPFYFEIYFYCGSKFLYQCI